MSTATYQLNITMGQPAFSGDRIEITFIAGTAFLSPSMSTTAGGGTFSSCAPSAEKLTCTISATGTSFPENGPVALHIFGVVNPITAHSGDSARTIRLLNAVGDGVTTGIKSVLTDGVTNPISPGPVSVTMTRMSASLGANTRFTINWDTRQGFALYDKIYIALPEFTTLVPNPRIAGISVCCVNFNTTSSGSGTETPSVTLQVTSGSVPPGFTGLNFDILDATNPLSGYLPQTALEARLMDSAGRSKDRTTSMTAPGMVGDGLGRYTYVNVSRMFQYVNLDTKPL